MRIVILSLALALGFICSGLAQAAEQHFTVVNLEFEGTKIWVPSTLVVRKGDKVTLKLINNVKSEPAVHGFSIPEFKVAVSVTRGEPATVEFVADRTGIFPTSCQFHPGHVGGELVVLE